MDGVVLPQSQSAAGCVVDAPLPGLPAVLQSAGAEGFLHLLIPVGAVAVAVLAPGAFVLQPLQSLRNQTLTGFALSGSGLGEGQAGLHHGHRLFPW